MKKLFIILLAFFFLININYSFAGGLLIYGNDTEKQINKFTNELDFEQRREFYRLRNDYTKYASLYETEIYKEKYKIGKTNKENKKKFFKKKNETLEKIKKISKEIYEILKKSKGFSKYKITQNLLEEFKLDNIYLETTVEDSPHSFYEQIFKFSEDEDILGEYGPLNNNFELPKIFKNTIYIVKTKKQKERKKENQEAIDEIDLIASIDFGGNNTLYEKKDFQKLDFQKINFDDFKKNGLKINFLKEFKTLKDNNLISLSIFIEYNGLYLSLDGGNFAVLENNEKGKLNYLKKLYYKKNGFYDEYDFIEKKSNCNNKFLNEKIKSIIDNLEKKINNKKKFESFLLKINKRIEFIKGNYKKEGLKIASKINPNSNMMKIFKEYEKYMYKGEVIKILGEYIKFKLKENYYDSTLNEIFEK